QDARRENRPAAEGAQSSAAVPEPQASAGQTAAPQESDEASGRRWRGRRRRRGGRGPGGQPADSEAPEQVYSPPARPVAEESRATFIHEPEAPAAPPAARGQRTPEPFVLPGETLSKYGGAPGAESSRNAPEPAPPPRPASKFKPSTLIDTPIEWDGSGLLPGESLSLRRRQVEPEAGAADEPQSNSTAAPESGPAHYETVEEEEEFAPTATHESAAAASQEADFEFEEESFAEDAKVGDSDEEGNAISAASGMEAGETESATEGETTLTEEESDASASHRVDPSSPTGFRLFGLGGKKKKEDESAAAIATAAPQASAYAPGTGLIEEEVIEGEELEAASHLRRHKPEAHDLDDYEEETLPTHLRTGDLGEMLQEAHLDHRIQMNFDAKGVEEEEFEAGEEETSTGAQPAPGRERRDRGGRGQRGRGVQGQRRGPSRRSAQTSDLPIISDLLKSGQEILVQIAKEPIAKKGARITSHIALPGRFLVFMPTVTHVGVSRKIASDEERHRLKRILTHERGEASGGFIVRTAAEGASEEELRADLRFLMNLWNEIKQRSESSKSPALIYHDLSLIERILRDQVSSNFASIWVDTQEDYERIVRFLNRFSPSLVRRVKLYTKEIPLFEHFGIQDEISKALRSKVWLKSGGSIVINQTEALVAIDINTGKYVGKSARLEDTIVKTNLDAVPEIVRQIRLRDLGGIIVIDFIDMDERKNRYRVLAALEEALKADRAPTKVLQFNDFGLVAITRKRVKQSLERTLSVPCPTCQATGMVKSSATVCNEIFIEMRKMRKHFENADVMLRVNPETVKILKSNNNRWLTDFE
ncbi:MAG: Rne/Rng family ribonuclease, partial [Terracidiphilus sp.]